MKRKSINKALCVCLLVLFFKPVTAQRNHHLNHPCHHPRNHIQYNPYYRYTNLPHWGYTYRAVPRGTFIYPHGGIQYYYYNGIYYKPVGKKYVIVKAPIGIRVGSLPSGNVHMVINGRKYFYYYGTYYARSLSNKEYITVEPPIGARVDALPDAYRKIFIDNKTYFKFEGTYYKAVVDESGEVWYEVVGKNN